IPGLVGTDRLPAAGAAGGAGGDGLGNSSAELLVVPAVALGGGFRALWAWDSHLPADFRTSGREIPEPGCVEIRRSHESDPAPRGSQSPLTFWRAIRSSFP